MIHLTPVGQVALGIAVLLLLVFGATAVVSFGPPLWRKFRGAASDNGIQPNDRKLMDDHLFACEEFFRTKLPSQEALDHLTELRRIFTKLENPSA